MKKIIYFVLLIIVIVSCDTPCVDYSSNLVYKIESVDTMSGNRDKSYYRVIGWNKGKVIDRFVFVAPTHAYSIGDTIVGFNVKPFVKNNKHAYN